VTEVIYKLCSVFSNKKWVEPAQPECWSKQFVGSLEAVLTHSKTIGLSRFNRMNNEKKFIGVLNIFCQWVQPAPPDFEKGEFQNQLWWKLVMSSTSERVIRRICCGEMGQVRISAKNRFQKLLGLTWDTSGFKEKVNLEICSGRNWACPHCKNGELPNEFFMEMEHTGCWEK